ncbi:MAG TPA: ParB/RepB/Spo0J family partition protein [Candidatus Limnocylindrales bacterium]|nr:ParB/RepB/Spo0J family partition protein [Candidatus Limnocylindrales bacterium]
MSALIREPEPQPQPQQPAAPSAAAGAATAAAPALAPSDGLLQIDIDLIDPSPYQPRTRFREEALDELARSIQSSGIVQPLVVRKIGARYQLIAGERRWRAAQRASLQRVPVVIRAVPEELALEMTLVENLQREDLNPMEQAHAFQRLMDEFALTQEQVAERTGKDRATIANSVRLLRLEEPIQTLLEEGRITAGHARALLAVPDSTQRVALARKIARTGMTVRQVERLATRAGKPVSHSAAPRTVDPNTKAAIDELQRAYGTRVLITPAAANRPGHLLFEYYTDSDLARLYDILISK